MAKNPFTGIRWSSAFTVIFGILSLIVGISEMCVWLAVLGVYGNISTGGKLFIYDSHAGVSGAALVLMASCGMWCGLWMEGCSTSLVEMNCHLVTLAVIVEQLNRMMTGIIGDEDCSYCHIHLRVFLTGVCGCSMRLGQPSDKNNRTRIVVCIASVANTFLFCPIQIALYAYLFTPEEAWIDELLLIEPVWWATMLQAIGIASGAASLILSIISTIIAVRIKPYAGRAKTWDELQI